MNLGLVLKSGTIIMEGVHGSFKPGRICAIMGPSGAGWIHITELSFACITLEIMILILQELDLAI